MRNLSVWTISKTKFYSIVCIIVTILFVWAGFRWLCLRSPKPDGFVRLIVRIEDRTLTVYSDDRVFKQFPIAIGKPETPTPEGEWIIDYKEHSDKPIFGPRWMRLDVPWGSYGIHGTNMPRSIGGFESSGCVRMRNRDAEELYEWVEVGTPVRIVGARPVIHRELAVYTKGQEVAYLQMKLKELGYLESKATGIFGKDTEEAVKRFQHDHRLGITGKTDRKTLKLLDLLE